MTVLPLPGHERPVLPEAAYYGLIGEAVRAMDACTEAHPAAVLGTLFTGIGTMIGPGPVVMLSAVSPQWARVWTLLAGRTGIGRKGTSAHVAKYFLEKVNPQFMHGANLGGSGSLSTGEGLLWALRDAAEPTEEERKKEAAGKPVSLDPGVTDKRLLIIEGEFGRVLTAGRREGNTLHSFIRTCWDEDRLASMVKANPVRSTRPHVGIVGHITAAELKGKGIDIEVRNGLLNRFVPLVVHKSKRLPGDVAMPEDELIGIAGALRVNLGDAYRAGARRYHRDAAGESLWLDHLYDALEVDEDGNEDLDDVLTRGQATVTRIALIHALANGHGAISHDDLLAAAAYWRFAADSARYLWAQPDQETADVRRLVDSLRIAGADGLTRTQVDQVFTKNRTGGELDALTKRLVDSGWALVEDRVSESGRGRRARVLRAIATGPVRVVPSGAEEATGATPTASVQVRGGA